MTKPLSLLCCIAFIMIGMTSCRYSELDKTFTYSDEWEIDYPSFLRKSTHVYPGSELQLANGYRDTYIFVREVITQLQVDTLIDSLASTLLANLEDPQVESRETTDQNGDIFHTVELIGLLNDMKMYYLLSVIESDGQIYQYSGWMFNHKRDLWEADYKRMLNSWKRI